MKKKSIKDHTQENNIKSETKSMMCGCDAHWSGVTGVPHAWENKVELLMRYEGLSSVLVLDETSLWNTSFL